MPLLNSRQLKILSLSEPFKDLGEEALTFVAEKCEMISLPAQSILFKQEDIGDCLYVIETGQVAINRKRPNSTHQDRIATYGSGNTIGSLAINKHHKRSASVHTLEASSLIKFTRNAFDTKAEHDSGISKTIERALLRRTHRLYLGFVMRTNPVLAKLPPEVL